MTKPDLFFLQRVAFMGGFASGLITLDFKLGGLGRGTPISPHENEIALVYFCDFAGHVADVGIPLNGVADFKRCGHDKDTPDAMRVSNQGKKRAAVQCLIGDGRIEVTRDN